MMIYSNLNTKKSNEWKIVCGSTSSSVQNEQVTWWNEEKFFSLCIQLLYNYISFQLKTEWANVPSTLLLTKINNYIIKPWF